MYNNISGDLMKKYVNEEFWIYPVNLRKRIKGRFAQIYKEKQEAIK